MSGTFITNSFSETQKLGMDLIKNTGKRRIYALYGDLGSGKTTFVQGLARGVGIHKKIISPTFIIIRSYKIPITYSLSLEEPEPGRRPITNFYHIDLYRLNSQNQALDLGLIELMDDRKNLIAVEWPEKIESLLPGSAKKIYFKYVDADKREIIIKE